MHDRHAQFGPGGGDQREIVGFISRIIHADGLAGRVHATIDPFVQGQEDGAGQFRLLRRKTAQRTPLKIAAFLARHQHLTMRGRRDAQCLVNQIFQNGVNV